MYRKIGLYEKIVKRLLDVICSCLTVIVFAWIYILIAILVKIKLGSPIIFKQQRPGIVDKRTGKETIFKMYKFRTMTNEKDPQGKLMPDEVRLTKFGAWLRSTSLDELPEVFNILKGDMSIIGPRPQLIRDMVFMSKEQRMRHTAKPGLSGLAQVNGRNAILWEDKLAWDINYIKKVSFINDLKIVLKTVGKVFVKKEGITEDNMATAEDFGDYLLSRNKIDINEYKKGQISALELMNNNTEQYRSKTLDKLCFSVSMCIYHGDRAEWFLAAIDSILNQTIKPNEIVIVVDGDIDYQMNKIVSELDKNSFFKIIRLNKNYGQGIARKISLDNCSNELVAMMDADDINAINRFEKELNLFKNNPILSVAGGAVIEFETDVNRANMLRTVKEKDEEIKKDLRHRCPMNQPTVMLKKTDIDAVGGYIDWFCNEDYYLWIRMCKAGLIFENVNEPLVYMRMNSNSYKRRGGRKYFKSELELQKYMLKNRMISVPLFCMNVTKRFIVQILMNSKMRCVIFNLCARKKTAR